MKDKCPNCGHPQKGAVEEILEEEWDSVEPRSVLFDSGVLVTFPTKSKICTVLVIQGEEWIARPVQPYSEKKFTWERL